MLSEPRAEELIRAALAVQADRAVESAEVLAGLDPVPPARGRRNRTLGLVAVAAAVVAAVAVPVGLELGRPAPPAAPPVTSTPAAPGVATPYQIGWVPAGYVAAERSASRDGSRYESQWRPPGGTQAVVQLVAAAGTPATPCPARPEAVSVGTAPGQYRMCGVKAMGTQHVWIAQVQWSPRAGWYLTLAVRQQSASATPDRAMVLRLAGSVTADPSARLDAPLTVSQVPPGVPAADDFGVSQVASPPGWDGTWGLPIIPLGTHAASVTSPQTSFVVVYWGPSSTGPGARPACIPDDCQVFVQAHGWWLEVDLSGPGVTQQQASAVADSVTVRPGVTYPWLGRP